MSALQEAVLTVSGQVAIGVIIGMALRKFFSGRF